MDKENLHVGIVLDGNRRWAKARGLHSWDGHKAGSETLKKVLLGMEGSGVRELTVYIFSMQNFKRAEEEKSRLFELAAKYFREMGGNPKIAQKGIRLNFIGRIGLLPENLQKAISELMEKTSDNRNYIVNFAMGYGGREEMVDAMKSIAKKVEAGELRSEDVNDAVVSDNLYLKSEPDLIIRTGGDTRTSNFLIWQSSYSEWFFLEKYWPDFSIDDLKLCITQFKNRGRRFGK
ncbi:MAG: polyprenyl diphosphate synthase [Candidatus Nanoarchaeia archaeon]